MSPRPLRSQKSPTSSNIRLSGCLSHIVTYCISCHLLTPKHLLKRNIYKNSINVLLLLCFKHNFQRLTYIIPLCVYRVTGGELFEDIVAREYYSEADARSVWT